MVSRLIALFAVAAALALPATAAGALARAGQFEGVLAANSCGAVRHVSVSGPTRIDARFAATNAGGYVFAQILGPAGDVRSTTGSYSTPSGGTYGVRACFLADDGIDAPQIEYVGTIFTAGR